ncbi:MAG: nucleotidyltransferase domain-containing protein [Clostridia bacterium]|nr:nucleotidyltransferase domain-containing protein [Clostridia bacterium]
MHETILQKVTQALRGCPGILAVVLGGSHATGTATETSDIDIGIYYDPAALDLAFLNRAAQSLDDARRADLVCPAGGWGPWVNCGGWLSIDGVHVDLILRDQTRVQSILDSTDRGLFSCHYQTGHPHAYLDVMYRGELACCRILHANDPAFMQQKQRAEVYPPALQKALVDFFRFEAGFSCGFLENYAAGKDAYYLAGQAFRSVSALNQALFALNKQWLLNEKKAVLRAEQFAFKLPDYKKRTDSVFRTVADDPVLAAKLLHELCSELDDLCSAL